jgi:hypothetical protein
VSIFLGRKWGAVRHTPDVFAHLTPSDFALFGNVKRSLPGSAFASAAESLAAIRDVVINIPAVDAETRTGYSQNGDYYP